MKNINNNINNAANLNNTNNTKNNNKKGETTMKQATKLTSNQRQDNVIDIIKEMSKRSNLNMGIASIEFPDGSVVNMRNFLN